MVEYLLTVGTLCGLISSVDLLISSFFSLPYCYIGETMIIVLFFFDLIQIYPFIPLFELKYEAVLKNKPMNKSDEDRLTVFLLIR